MRTPSFIFSISFRADHAFCLLGERCMERNIIGFAEKRIKIYQVYSQLLASFQRNVRVIANGLHVERLQTFCYIGAYTATPIIPTVLSKSWMPVKLLISQRPSIMDWCA